MFRRREFSGGTGTMMIWAFGILGIYFFTSLYLQQTLGFSPDQGRAGLRADGAGVAVFAGIAPRIEARAGAHRTVAAGMLLMVIGLVLFARLGLHASYTGLLPGFIMFGAGAGLMNVPLTNAVMARHPAVAAGVASALLNASREVAGLLGITVIGAVLRTRASRRAARRRRARCTRSWTATTPACGSPSALLAAGVVVSYVTLRPRRGRRRRRRPGHRENSASSKPWARGSPRKRDHRPTPPDPGTPRAAEGHRAGRDTTSPAPRMIGAVPGLPVHDNRRHHRQRDDRRHRGPAECGRRVPRRY